MSINPSIRSSPVTAAPLAAVAAALIRNLDGALHASVAEPVDDVLTVQMTTDSDVEACGARSVGPALDALRLVRIIRIPSTQRSCEWPEHCADLVRSGIFSVGAFPIKDASGAVLGVLTVSSQDHHGFGAADIAICRAAADEMAVLINACR